MTNYTKFAVKGAAIVFVVSILAAFLGYIVRFLLANNLSLEEFGLFYSVFAFLGLLGVFKTLGFDKSLIKFIPEFKHKNKYNLIKSSIIYVSIIQLITNSVILLLVYLFSNYLSIHFFHNEQAGFVLKLMAIAFFIDSFVFVLKFAFQGFQKMMLFANIDLVRMALITVIILIGFRLNYKILSPVAAYIAAPVILMLIFAPILLKKVFPEFTDSKFILGKSLFKRIYKYSIFVMATGAGGAILGYTDSIVLTYFSGLKSVGLYNVALPTARVLTFFPMAIMGILIPLTSELWVKKQKILLRDGIELLYKYSIMVITPLALVMISFAELLITVLFGKEYLLAGNALRILSIGMIFATLYTINYSFFSGIGKPQLNSKIVYSAVVFNLVSNLVLVPLIGIIGAAITTSVGYIIMAVFGFAKIKDFVEVAFPTRVWIKTLIAGLVFTFAIWILKRLLALNVWLETVIVLATAGMIYIALLFLLGIVDITELKELRRRIFE